MVFVASSQEDKLLLTFGYLWSQWDRAVFPATTAMGDQQGQI